MTFLATLLTAVKTVVGRGQLLISVYFFCPACKFLFQKGSPPFSFGRSHYSKPDGTSPPSLSSGLGSGDHN